MGMHQPAWHTRLPHKTTHLQSVIVMAHKTSKTAAVMIQRIHGHRRANRYFCFCHTIPGCYWGTLSHFTTTSVLKVWLWHSFHMIHIFFPYWKDKYDISSGKSDILCVTKINHPWWIFLFPSWRIKTDIQVVCKLYILQMNMFYSIGVVFINRPVRIHVILFLYPTTTEELQPSNQKAKHEHVPPEVPIWIPVQVKHTRPALSRDLMAN